MKTTFMFMVLISVSICYTLNSNAQQGVTILGTIALRNNTTSGIYNTGLGYYSLHLSTSGNKNTGIGANTHRFNTTGIFNTAAGYASLYNKNTGSYNTAFGTYSLFSNT